MNTFSRGGRARRRRLKSYGFVVCQGLENLFFLHQSSNAFEELEWTVRFIFSDMETKREHL